MLDAIINVQYITFSIYYTRFRALSLAALCSSESRLATTSAPQWLELGLKLRVISFQSLLRVGGLGLRV